MKFSLNRTKFFPSFCVIFFVLQVRNSSLSPVRFSTEILSLRWIPVSEWVLGIRSLFLIFLLNHLPKEIQFSIFLGYQDLLSHSVFWDIFLMHPTFSVLQSQQSEYLLPKFSPANKACPRRILQIFVHFEISRLPGGLGHLVDSNSIPQNPDHHLSSDSNCR